MTNLSADERAADWTDQAVSTRVAMCAMHLHVHGFISDAENERVKRRIKKWLSQQGYGTTMARRGRER